MTQAMHQILIIEDDASIREVLQALLGSVGFRVVEAATAARADIEARAHKPDLLLVDLGLPDGDAQRARLVAGADHRTVGAHHGRTENRGAGCRR
jgi:DNA-binding response OmpR family regulator